VANVPSGFGLTPHQELHTKQMLNDRTVNDILWYDTAEFANTQDPEINTEEMSEYR
jgi:hypothetical protein